MIHPCCFYVVWLYPELPDGFQKYDTQLLKQIFVKYAVHNRLFQKKRPVHHPVSYTHLICAWGEDAGRLIKAHAKKGSLIWVTGSLELEAFTKRDGATADKRMKILLDNWGFVPVGKARPLKEGQAKTDPGNTSIQEYEGIDGDRDTLPG